MWVTFDNLVIAAFVIHKFMKIWVFSSRNIACAILRTIVWLIVVESQWNWTFEQNAEDTHSACKCSPVRLVCWLNEYPSDPVINLTTGHTENKMASRNPLPFSTKSHLRNAPANVCGTAKAHFRAVGFLAFLHAHRSHLSMLNCKISSRRSRLAALRWFQIGLFWKIQMVSHISPNGSI